MVRILRPDTDKQRGRAVNPNGKCILVRTRWQHKKTNRASANDVSLMRYCYMYKRGISSYWYVLSKYLFCYFLLLAWGNLNYDGSVVGRVYSCFLLKSLLWERLNQYNICRMIWACLLFSEFTLIVCSLFY